MVLVLSKDDLLDFLRCMDQKHMKPRMNRIATQMQMPITIHNLRPNGGVLEDSSALRISPVVDISAPQQPTQKKRRVGNVIRVTKIENQRREKNLHKKKKTQAFASMIYGNWGADRIRREIAYIRVWGAA
jgi:hypothetical protein